MYHIRQEKQADLDRLLIVNDISNEYVSIIPGFGANINELVLRKGNQLRSILAGNKKLEDFNGPGIFNSAKMLPFPNRIADGIYKFRDRSYQLEKNFTDEGNAIHGLVYYQTFEVRQCEENEHYAEVVLGLQCDNLHAGFPFKFLIEIYCRLDDDGEFICRTKVLNNGVESMPFGEGWHPFFGFYKPVDQLFLKFSADQLILVDQRLIPTGKTVKYNQFNQLGKIGDTLFDSCFKLEAGNTRHTAELYDSDQDLTVMLWQETGENRYNYLQVYIPPSRMSIALEPMTCNINAFNNGEGLQILEPGDSYEASYGIRIK